MEDDVQSSSEELTTADQPSVWFGVTPFSKYLALVLFVALPFIGGWIGYTQMPEKVVYFDGLVSDPRCQSVDDRGCISASGQFNDFRNIEVSSGMVEETISFKLPSQFEAGPVLVPFVFNYNNRDGYMGGDGDAPISSLISFNSEELKIFVDGMNIPIVSFHKYDVLVPEEEFIARYLENQGYASHREQCTVRGVTDAYGATWEIRTSQQYLEANEGIEERDLDCEYRTNFKFLEDVMAVIHYRPVEPEQIRVEVNEIRLSHQPPQSENLVVKEEAEQPEIECFYSKDYIVISPIRGSGHEHIIIKERSDANRSTSCEYEVGGQDILLDRTAVESVMAIANNRVYISGGTSKIGGLAVYDIETREVVLVDSLTWRQDIETSADYVRYWTPVDSEFDISIACPDFDPEQWRGGVGVLNYVEHRFASSEQTILDTWCPILE